MAAPVAAVSDATEATASAPARARSNRPGPGRPAQARQRRRMHSEPRTDCESSGNRRAGAARSCGGTDAQEVRRELLTGPDVHGNHGVLDPEFIEHDVNPVAVGCRPRVEVEHRVHEDNRQVAGRRWSRLRFGGRGTCSSDGTKSRTVAALVPDAQHFDSILHDPVDERKRRSGDRQLPYARDVFHHMPRQWIVSDDCAGAPILLGGAPRASRHRGRLACSRHASMPGPNGWMAGRPASCITSNR